MADTTTATKPSVIEWIVKHKRLIIVVLIGIAILILSIIFQSAIVNLVTLITGLWHGAMQKKNDQLNKEKEEEQKKIQESIVREEDLKRLILEKENQIKSNDGNIQQKQKELDNIKKNIQSKSTLELADWVKSL